IEGRHKSWFTKEAIEYLKEKNHCIVWNEVQGVENPAKITSDYVYIRLIGDRSIPESDFGRISINREQSIQKWSEKLKEIEDKGLKELIWEEKKQQRLEV
ncbi:MAG: DUF72 domain-containing protein, partial [Candidatus Nitrosomaritimum yanchengensis]